VNAQISPIVGETSPTATQLTATGTTASAAQQVGTVGINPASKTYVGGVWVKKLTSDASTVRVELVSTNTYTTTYTLTQAQGWQLLPINVTFTAGDIANLNFRIRWANASATSSIAAASAYLYDVTGRPGVLYPPVCITGAGATGIVKPTSCAAVTASGALLHPQTLRPLASTVRGSFGAVLVPTFDAASQPDGVVFDVAQGAAQNRVVLRVASGVMELKRWDNAGNTWTASVTLTSSATPAAAATTWLRDTEITVRALWDENSTMLSVGTGNASGTKPGSWAPSDDALVNLTIGCDYLLANQFEGMISDS
jgi:hypothetical protein